MPMQWRQRKRETHGVLKLLGKGELFEARAGRAEDSRVESLGGKIATVRRHFRLLTAQVAAWVFVVGGGVRKEMWGDELLQGEKSALQERFDGSHS